MSVCLSNRRWQVKHLVQRGAQTTVINPPVVWGTGLCQIHKNTLLWTMLFAYVEHIICVLSYSLLLLFWL